MRRALRDSEESFHTLADGGSDFAQTCSHLWLLLLVSTAANLLAAHAEAARPACRQLDRVTAAWVHGLLTQAPGIRN